MSATTHDRNRQLGRITGAIALALFFFGGGVATRIETQLAVIGVALVFALASAHFFGQARRAKS